MIQLMFTVLTAEAAVAIALLFKTPVRKLAMLGLDRLKRGRGPVMVRTVAATVLVVLASSVHSMNKIRGHAAGELDGAGAGTLTPTDQVLLARHLLEASLMGYSLFLALVIDRLHNYIREVRGLKRNLEAASKLNKTLDEAKLLGSSDESKTYQKDIASLNEEIKKMKRQLKEKANEAKDAEAKALAAQKQSEGLMIEYNHLVEDNKHLHDQLESVDLTVSRSDGKKNT
uniref:Endoplasmic reticulum transmembrane protein n=1 Tax=Oryza barthii TaxID=65489 RepID=A0A0D3GGJ3_9ORYZ